MPLSAAAINVAKRRSKPYKLFDEKGLFLSIEPAGGRLWRLKYRIDGKEKKLSSYSLAKIIHRRLTKGIFLRKGQLQTPASCLSANFLAQNRRLSSDLARKPGYRLLDCRA